MRELSEHGRLKPGTALTARQQIIVAGQFLTYFEAPRDRRLPSAAERPGRQDFERRLA